MQHLHSKRSLLWGALYGFFLVTALLAGHFRYQAVNLFDSMNSKAKKALQLQTIAIMESMEMYFLQVQEDRDESKANELENASHRFFYRSKVDEIYADRERQRAEYFAMIARQEQHLANNMYIRLQQDEQLYADIIKNMSIDQKREDELKQELQQVHQGACAFKPLWTFCDVVEGAVDLQREIDQEAVQLQQELRQRDELSHREFLEEFTANTLQGRANQFNQTATDILKTAEYWDERARVDYLQGVLYNKSAYEYHMEAQHLEEQEKKEDQWEESNISMSEQLLTDSQVDYRRAIRLAWMSILLAVPALIFFAPRVTSKTTKLVHSIQAWAGNEHTTSLELWRCVSYIFIHVLIFLLGVGMVRDLLRVIYQYAWGQRSAIIAWFALSTALFQTVSLHSVPHLMAEWPVNQSDIYNIAKHSVFRLTFLTILFGLELLLVWVNAGQWMLTTRVVSFFGHWWVFFVVLALIAYYIYCFEPRESVPMDDLQSRFTDCDEDGIDACPSESQSSEITPLTYGAVKMSNSSGPTTVAFMTMDLSPTARGDQQYELRSLYSLDSVSPYYCGLWPELKKLQLLFEMLESSCMVGVLRTCLPVVCHSWQSILIVAVYLVVAVVVAWKTHWFRTQLLVNDEIWSSSKSAERHNIEIISV